MPNPQPTQQPNQTMDHASAKASMGVATFLQSHLLPQKQQQAPQTSEPAPQPPTNQETGTDVTAQIQGLENRVFDEMGTLKDMIQKSQPDANKELEDMKKELQAIIDSKE